MIKRMKKQTLLGTIVAMILFLGLGTTRVAGQSAWDITSGGGWQLKGGTIDFSEKGITFHADKGNRCNPYTKSTHAVNNKTVIYYKVKPVKDVLSIKDAKISIFIPDYSLNEEEGMLNIKQLRGYEVGRDKKGNTWVAFDLSKLGIDNKKQSAYTFEFQVKGSDKAVYSSKDSNTDTYNVILKDLKENEYAGNRFDFVLISKLDEGNESFTMSELGTAASVEEVKAKIK